MDGLVLGVAVVNDELEVAQWLRGKGCPWDERDQTCWSLIEGCEGPLDVDTLKCVSSLRWARANGAPWHARDRETAELLGYTDDFDNEYEDPDEYEDSDGDYGF